MAASLSQHVVGDLSAGGDVVAVGRSDVGRVGDVEGYYAAYKEYLAAFRDICSGQRASSNATVSLGLGNFCLAPPMWRGCVRCCCSAMSFDGGDSGGVGAVGVVCGSDTGLERSVVHDGVTKSCVGSAADVGMAGLGRDVYCSGGDDRDGCGDGVPQCVASDVVKGDSGGVLNPVTERNRKKRFLAKLRKRRKQGFQPDLETSDEQKGSGVVRSGFWNSCSDDVRQNLIDSKARMHIADNMRKAKEAEKRIEYLDSAQATVDHIVKLAEFAQKQAKKEGDEHINGWAATVSRSSAVSLAKSVPSSVPSFDSYSEQCVNDAVAVVKEQYERELSIERERNEKLQSAIKKTAGSSGDQIKSQKIEEVGVGGQKQKVLVKPVRRADESCQDFSRRYGRFRNIHYNVTHALGNNNYEE